jgi:glycine betaine/proline transport system substrate-binding protein
MKVKNIFMLTIIMIISTVVFTACDAIEDATDSVTGGGLEGEGEALVFAGLNWDSALVQTAVARYILDEGYGYETDQINGATTPLFQGLIKGDIGISMEIWLPNQKEVWANAVKDGQVFSTGNSLEDNWQSTFIIPGFIQDANPGLKNVQDLKKPEYQELFAEADSGGKAVLYGCMAQWACRGVNEGQVVAYGLEDHVDLRDPGTMGALNAAIEGAYLKKEPLLFYYWGPTKLANENDMRVLEQPDPSECADSDPKLGCGFPIAEVLIALHSDYEGEGYEELRAFLEKWDWNATNQLAAEGQYAEIKDSSDVPYEDTAKWYLNNNEGWKSWVTADAKDLILTSLSA